MNLCLIIFAQMYIFIIAMFFFYRYNPKLTTNSIMKQELTSASNLIVHFLRLQQKDISEYTIAKFNKYLIKMLSEKYCYFWFPEYPHKCSSYRCLRFHSKLDNFIIEAGKKCKLSETFLIDNLSPLMVWIDPNEVSYRLGENNSIYIIYDQDSLEPWKHLSHVENKKCSQTNNIKYKTSFTFFHGLP